MNFNSYKKKFKKAQNFLTIRNAYISPELLLVLSIFVRTACTNQD